MGERLFAIGDIHGCAAELETLLRGLPLGAGDTVVFIGDYLDRGPDSARVVDLVLELEQRTDVNTVCLKGNHEDMCLAFMGSPGRGGEIWVKSGGAAALASYGLDARAGAAEFAAALPATHLAFLQRLEKWHEAGAHLFVHAGIHPGRPLAQQDDGDLFWIREPFLGQPHPLPLTVVYGHTPHREPSVDLPYKVGIDTGCVYGGALTALDAAEGWIFQVRRGERKVRERALGGGTRH